MQAVVLAAGQGTRLRLASPVKPLTPVAERPLILHTLDRLRAGGATSAVVVLGYAGDAIRPVLDALDTLPLTLVDNPDWRPPTACRSRRPRRTSSHARCCAWPITSSRHRFTRR